ncbi:MAG: hypothetical protein P9L94_07010 [Candidatus Hinthialibacter antarcticus]|nr:hypothetical protein [Candidatus Hinthialibacter antarcticus]
MNQSQVKRSVDWIGIAIIAAMVGVLCVSGAFAQTASSDKVLFVQVKTEDGVNIDASLPFSVLETLIDSAPKELDEIVKKHSVHVREMLAELKKMEGKDLVRVIGANDVRIGVLAWQSEEDNFIKVNVKPGGEDEDVEEVNICLPKGLVTIALAAAKDLDLGEDQKEIGKIVEEIMKAVSEGMKQGGDNGDDHNGENEQ